LQRLLHAEDPKAYTILNKLGNSVAYKRGGRLLAYVYLPDGTMLNTLLVQEEYAQVMIVFPKVKYQDMFLKLQREARDNNKRIVEKGNVNAR